MADSVHRQGVGSALLSSRVTRCTAAGEDAYLVCTRQTNLSVYEAAGFALTGLFHLPDSTPLWQMWRDAGSSR